MDAVRYIVDTLLWLLMLAFVLRLLFQWVRADFRDPFADAVVRVTNWLILPLRRILPPLRRVDTATVVAVLAASTLHAAAVLALGPGLIDLPSLLRIALVGLIDMILRIYLFALLVYWLMSFIAPGGSYAPGTRLLAQLCEPILRPVRRLIPPIGQIDFSILWVSIAIGALLILLR